MNYIYDILANFNDSFYDFYDWNENDHIIHIKKLPVIKVKTDFLINVKYNDVNVDNRLIEKIYRRCDFFNESKNNYSYVCSLCDGREAIIVSFDSNGNVLGKSDLLIDEGNEVIDICDSMDVSDYSISVKDVVFYDNFKTRRECKINSFILKELDNMSYDKLKYLYFDCFNEQEDDIKKILIRIFDEIKNNFDMVYLKIYDFLKLTSINK